MGKRTFCFRTGEIDAGKFLPIGKDQYRIRVFDRLVDTPGVDHCDRRRQHRGFGALVRCRIISGDNRSGRKQLLDHVDRRRVANVIGAALKGQAECREAFAAQESIMAARTLLKKISF